MWAEKDTSPDSSSAAPMMLHFHSSPSLIGNSPNDGTSCSIALSELSSESDCQSIHSGVLRQSANFQNAPWTTAIAIHGENNQTAETDGYFTAHASMVSVVPENVDNLKTSIQKPNNFGEEVFIEINSPAPLLSSNDYSPTASSQSGDVCRICHGEFTMENPLISPCNCSGSMKYVHQECIQLWLKSSHSLSCELCRFTYLTGSKVKPFRQWKSLELSLLERWKVVCCVMIQLFAICYFVLSVEALVRAAKDFYVPQAAMWLWIKIIMSVFGITVSVACTIRQCKTFIRLFRRWQIHNRNVYVKDRHSATEGHSAIRTLLGSK